MKVIYCPIETSLNFQQANKMIKDLKPEVLVIPKVYTQPPVVAPHREDLVIDRQIVSLKIFKKEEKKQIFYVAGEADHHI